MKKYLKHVLTMATLLAIFCAVSISAFAQTQTVYNSVSKPLPGNVASEGPEAYAFAELGDGLSLADGAGGTLGQVSVIMSSWGCQSGTWYDGNCSSAPNATFSQPLTIKVYSVGPGPSAGALLGSMTKTFDIPYRPSANPGKCPSTPTKWYSTKEGACFNGIANEIQMNFASQHIVIPDDGKVILTVSFNSSHYGPEPIGNTACNATVAGCPYDSLNISTDTTNGTFQFVGSPLDANGIFVNYTNAYSACNPSTQPTGILAMDTGLGCWAGYHPQISVKVNTNVKHSVKGNTP